MISPDAQQPDDLLPYAVWIALVVSVLVQGLSIYTVVRFRQSWWWECRYAEHGGFATANESVVPVGVSR